MERECVKERERGGREGGKNTGIHTQSIILTHWIVTELI